MNTFAIPILLLLLGGATDTATLEGNSHALIDALLDDSTSWQEKREALQTLGAQARENPRICFRVARALPTIEPSF